MSLIEENSDDFDLGINPKEIFNSKNLISKGFIGKNDPITLAILLGIQGCDYENGDIVKDVVSYYIQLTGSVDGKKLKLFIDGAKARVNVNDMQTTKTVEGE